MKTNTKAITFGILLMFALAPMTLAFVSTPVVHAVVGGAGGDAFVQATATTPETWTGKFTSETGYVWEYNLKFPGVSESDSGPTGGAGDYSFQLNSNVHFGASCVPSNIAIGCSFQFIYQACPTSNCGASTRLFIEEWFSNWGSSCPPGFTSSGSSDCYKNIDIITSGVPTISPGSLLGAYLSGTASSTQVTPKVCNSGGTCASQAYTLLAGCVPGGSLSCDVPSPAGNWGQSEFNIFGVQSVNGHADQSVFNPGVALIATITAPSTVNSCPVGSGYSGSTAEMNDLQVLSCTKSGSVATLTEGDSATQSGYPNILNPTVTKCTGTNNCTYCTGTTSCSTTVSIKAGDLIIVSAQGEATLSISDNSSGGINTGSGFGSGWNKIVTETYGSVDEASTWIGHNTFGCASSSSCYSTFSDKITITQGGGTGDIAIEVLAVPAGVGYTVFTTSVGWRDSIGGYNNCASSSSSYVCVGSVTQSGHPYVEVASIAASPGSSNSTPGSGYTMEWGLYNPNYDAEFSTSQATTTFPFTDNANGGSTWWVDSGVILGTSSNGA